MSPHPTVAPPPIREDLQETERREVSPPPREAHPRQAADLAHKELFTDALLDLSSTRPGTRTWDVFLSLFIHTIFVGTLLLIPLFFTEAIDLKQFTQTFLVVPPPPPPPPPAAPTVTKIAPAPRRVFTQAGRLVAPTVIPERIAMLKEEALPPEVAVGVVGGVPGGVPGGQAGGVIGGIISGAPRTMPLAPPPSAPKAPIRVGGRIRAPRPLSTPEPVYPALAKQAKVQGDVIIDAVIDLRGSVVEMQVVSGHPLLIPAAMEALRKWRYEPTYLNEEPVAVQLLVTIKFRLN